MANEKRLIDANALMDAFRIHMVERYDKNKCTLEENCKTCEPGCLWRKKVSEAPTVDAVEVVHGRWKEVDDGVLIGQGKHFECSECKMWAMPWRLSNYCPNCGAKMDGDGNAI